MRLRDRTIIIIIIIIVVIVVVGRTIGIVNERVGDGCGIPSISGVCGAVSCLHVMYRSPPSPRPLLLYTIYSAATNDLFTPTTI